jgi:hypothetical protein
MQLRGKKPNYITMIMTLKQQQQPRQQQPRQQQPRQRVIQTKPHHPVWQSTKRKTNVKPTRSTHTCIHIGLKLAVQ